MKFIALDVEERHEKGKSISKALRRENKIPGVIYGKNAEPKPIAVNTTLLEKVVKDTSTMEVFLELSTGKETFQVMLKELQADIVNEKYIHADFLILEKDKAIDFRVPVEIVGEESCVGIENGGMLQTLRRELDVRCTVENMPGSIKVDVSKLDVGESIHIEDIDLGENVEIFTDVNFTVATMVATASGTDDDSEESDAGEEAPAADSEE